MIRKNSNQYYGGVKTKREREIYRKMIVSPDKAEDTKVASNGIFGGESSSSAGATSAKTSKTRKIPTKKPYRSKKTQTKDFFSKNAPSILVTILLALFGFFGKFLWDVNGDMRVMSTRMDGVVSEVTRLQDQYSKINEQQADSKELIGMINKDLEHLREMIDLRK